METLVSGSALPSFWQVLAALMLVFGLLILGMRWLKRFSSDRSADGDVRLLRVRRLGPKRELQTLQVDGEVYTIYRQDGALAVLKREPAEPVPATAVETPQNLGRRLLAMVAQAGGGTRSTFGPNGSAS